MDTWHEPARDVPVIARPDVVVVGAGSAGVAAAVAAARGGASTWLVEASGTLGGLASVGLINLLLTLDDGDGTQVVAGLCQEVVDRMEACGEAYYPPRGQWGTQDPSLVERWRAWGLIWGAPEVVRYSVAFDPDAFIDACSTMLADAGVRVRLRTSCVSVALEDGRISALLLESKSGREALVPSVVVDATGDGDVLARAGAAFDLVTIPPHLWFRVGGVNWDPDQAGPDGLGALAFRTTVPGRVLVPFGPLEPRVDACDANDLSRAEISARAAAREELLRLRREVPAFGSAWLDGYAAMLGITESRRLVGDYVLTKEDGDVRFADSIAQTGHWTRRHVVFGIPLRCLTAPGIANLLVAGRCISTTRYVHQATKEIPAAMATGQAAGAAAAVSASAALDVHELDVAALRASLRAAGAIVGELS